ncbi:MAG: BsaWI family type II restriction enzyme [Pseudoflavonifractor sp.]|nr:BsaWI family type II restriction enzyme [Alloprevotella sp.]MCM1117003.1 BsaWI family type II restriction enzyme [Pseudoflavonifractor sp.]
MSKIDYKSFCSEIYTSVFEKMMEKQIASSKVSTSISEKKMNEFEVAAQKEAIKLAIIKALATYPEVNAALIWRAIYETHIHHKSGIYNADIIHKVISADQSWKKSSGHAFEEMVKLLASAALADNGIEIILQRDLSTLIKAEEINNEPRDISWLKEQIAGDVFDLYAVVKVNDKKYCFGCIQCKTSIRDRVTRDREPSLRAMQSYFWSVAIVLDGDFLKLKKFKEMVDGGTSTQQANGWHGMYIFTEEEMSERIFHTNVDFEIFKQHAVEAAKMWSTQRQWFNEDWKPTTFALN